MKKTFLRFATAAMAAFCLTGCVREYTPLCYQQIYDLYGVRADASEKYTRGEPLPVKGYKTELQTLFQKYPSSVQNMKKGVYRLGWFFRQEGMTRVFGEAIGDLCNHAAWFVLHGNFSAAQQEKYAKQIANLLVSANEQEAMAFLQELRRTAIPEYKILQSEEWYDPANQFGLKKLSERVQGAYGDKINPRFGLERTYYESGMMKTEVYYKNDAPIGYAFTFTEDGRMNSAYYYDGKGNRELLYQLVQ